MGRTANKLRYFLRYYGISRAASSVLSKLVPKLISSQRFINWKESAIDRKFGIETVGSVEVADLDIDSTAKTHAVEYCPTSGVSFGVILKELGINHSEFTFIDFGCGKGRVLCLAAEFPFKAIVGVELSESLCSLANQNVSRMFQRRKRCHDIQVRNVDATTLEFPAAPLVLYFFNPFGEEIMRQVLDRLVTDLDAVSRETFVVYSNPVHRELFDNSEFWDEYDLEHGPTPHDCVVYRARSP